MSKKDDEIGFSNREKAKFVLSLMRLIERMRLQYKNKEFLSLERNFDYVLSSMKSKIEALGFEVVSFEDERNNRTAAFVQKIKKKKKKILL